MGEDLGVGQRCRARGTSTSDAPLLASLYVTLRCTTLSVSTTPPLCPSSTTLCVSPSLSLMNSIAINSIKTSVVLGGFYPLPAARRCTGDGEETRSRGKSSKQSSRRSMNSWHRGNNNEGQAYFSFFYSR